MGVYLGRNAVEVYGGGVKVKPEEEKTVTPSASQQIVSPSTGKVLSKVTVNGDADLISENIKAGINIFGVDGKSSVVDTEDATAAAGNILSGKTAYVDGSKLTGNIPSKSAATYTPGTIDQSIAVGQYLSGEQIIKGDANLTEENIKRGVSIFGTRGIVDEVEFADDGLGTFYAKPTEGENPVPMNVFEIETYYVEDTVKQPEKLWDFTTWAGSDEYNNIDSDVAVDKDGNVYSYANPRYNNDYHGILVKASSDGELIWSKNAFYGENESVVTDKDGNVYFNQGTGRVVKCAPDGTKIWDVSQGSGHSYSLGVNDDGVVCYGRYSSLYFHKPDGTLIQSNSASNYVHSIVADSNGDFYVNANGSNIAKFTASGNAVYTVSTSSYGVSNLGSRVIALAKPDDIYYCDSKSPGNIRHITNSGSTHGIFKSFSRGSMGSLAIDKNGYLYVCDYMGYLAKIDTDADATLVWEIRAHTSTIYAITLGSDGSIHLSYGTHQLHKYSNNKKTNLRVYCEKFPTA